MGLKTKEKYEEFKKSDNFSSIFNNFKHYNFEEENKNDERFKNPHDSNDFNDEKADNENEFIQNNTSSLGKNENRVTTGRSNHERNLSVTPSKKTSDSFLKNYESPTKVSGLSGLTSRKATSLNQKSSNDIIKLKII